jgi:rhodanese-related sulfurtransferase
METATVQQAAAASLRGETVIDVRTSSEYAAGHLPHSIFMPLVTVPLRVNELSRRAPVYVVCESGSRAFQACQFLQQHGYRPINVVGGMAAYRAVGLPMRTASSQRVGAEW